MGAAAGTDAAASDRQQLLSTVGDRRTWRSGSRAAHAGWWRPSAVTPRGPACSTSPSAGCPLCCTYDVRAAAAEPLLCWGCCCCCCSLLLHMQPCSPTHLVFPSLLCSAGAGRRAGGAQSEAGCAARLPRHAALFAAKRRPHPRRHPPGTASAAAAAGAALVTARLQLLPLPLLLLRSPRCRFASLALLLPALPPSALPAHWLALVTNDAIQR